MYQKYFSDLTNAWNQTTCDVDQFCSAMNVMAEALYQIDKQDNFVLSKLGIYYGMDPISQMFFNIQFFKKFAVSRLELIWFFRYNF